MLTGEGAPGTSGEGGIGKELTLLHQAVAELQLVNIRGAEEWRSALAAERTSRADADAALDVAVARESKERAADLDELADDVREQVCVMVAPAIEFKKEGFVLGVGAKMFAIAGPVILFGTCASALVGLLYLIFTRCF